MNATEYHNQEAFLSIKALSRRDAARVLRIPTATLWRWLEGHKRGDVTYPPVIRPEPTNSKVLTWGEFLETALVTEYRRPPSVPLVALRRYLQQRRAIERKRYPLAYWRSYDPTSQNPADTSSNLLFLGSENKTRLHPKAESFLSHAQFTTTETSDSHKIIFRWLPEPEKFPAVKVDPLYSSGIPTIRGIKTEILHEMVTAGDSVERLAEIYEIESQLVQQASDYEITLR